MFSHRVDAGAPACPARVWASMAPAAATPTPTKGALLSGRRVAHSTAAATRPMRTPTRSSRPPAGEPSSVATDTPTEEASAAARLANPATPNTHVAASVQRRAGRRPPRATTPVLAAPSSSARLQ
jgi:hypothetical protein